MAGHSKWANIRFKKAAVDAKRGKLFTKLRRAITVAAKQNDIPDHNPALRQAIDKARAANMTRDAIERAIKSASGGDEASLEAVRYEGYGPSGVAVMVDCLTDNRRRTVADVRHAFSKHGGNLGTDGSVAYIFSQHGQIILSNDADEEKVMEIALENGAEDIQTDSDGTITVQTSSENYEEVKKALEIASLPIENAELTMIPANTITVNDSEEAKKLMRFLEVLEDLDDVQQVYSNLEIPDEIMAEM